VSAWILAWRFTHSPAGARNGTLISLMSSGVLEPADIQAFASDYLPVAEAKQPGAQPE